ncbi:aldehyde dehydrogenase [Fibrobacter sp. UWT2]|uniref:aldehyde dehydrogenase family protein n=1 Tax=Fibrobacter sp. UWT2 TaxID=1896224 RepID=UPI001C4A6697|nr:aldehyde dehydrogenase family protein [Fibrobacter sp. UWT2]
MIIDGKRADASDRGVIRILNPATQEFIDIVPKATASDVYQAIDAAQAGKRIWANTPTHERVRILSRCADAIEEHLEDLAQSLSREMGKIIQEARGEIRVSAQTIRGYAEAAAHHYGKTLTDSQKGIEKDILFTRHEPLGVVACITPFNYPVLLVAHKMAAALATGNAVIVKPASDNPLTLIKLVALCLEQGIPGNVLQIITGSGEVVGKILAENPKVNAISLTGSTEVGISLAETGAKTLKRVFLELGGNDPFIVLDDADISKAIAAAVEGRLENAGQTCCSSKRFLVHESIHDLFIKKLLEALSKIKHGSPQDDETEYGCLINGNAAQKVESQIQKTIEQGAKLICGGHAYNITYFEPTILDDVTLDMDIAKDMEVFGPVFPIITFKTDEDAVKIANASRYGLQAGVMTKSVDRAMHIAASLQCGAVVINGSGNYRHIEQPFGGYKMSGFGREGISGTLAEMTQEKTYVLKDVLIQP